jgi:hypothetical protein
MEYCAAPMDTHSAPDSRSPQASSSRAWDTAGRVALRALPIVFAIAAYWIAGTTKADIPSLQKTIQLAIGLVVGVASYTVITETTLLRLPRRLSRELDVLTSEIVPLKEAVGAMAAELTALANAVDTQLKTLIELHDMEILFDRKDALVRARTLQDNAKESIEAMWTTFPYEEALKEYFSDTLSEGPYACRIVAARNVGKADVLDHVEKMWDRLANETYEIYLTHDCNYEALVVDKEIAGLFIYSDRGFGSCFLSSPSKKFVRAVEGLIASLKKPDWKLPVGRNEDMDLARIAAWLDNYYESLP